MYPPVLIGEAIAVNAQEVRPELPDADAPSRHRSVWRIRDLGD
jgi:hypothetical protein